VGGWVGVSGCRRSDVIVARSCVQKKFSTIDIDRASVTLTHALPTVLCRFLNRHRTPTMLPNRECTTFTGSGDPTPMSSKSLTYPYPRSTHTHAHIHTPRTCQSKALPISSRTPRHQPLARATTTHTIRRPEVRARGEARKGEQHCMLNTSHPPTHHPLHIKSHHDVPPLNTPRHHARSIRPPENQTLTRHHPPPPHPQ
jgi:hypothetical protein